MNDRDVFNELYALQVAYWYEVDQHGGESATNFFIPNGLFVVGTERMSGHAEIAAFYAWRKRRGLRTARHLISNCQVSACNGDSAEFKCVMSLYADDGKPVLPANPPVMISDIEDVCVRQDGRWRFASHELRTVFQGGVQPTIPTRSELLKHTSTHTA